MKFVVLLVSAVALLTTSCASITSPARKSQLEPGHSYWFDYDASRRGMVMAVTRDAGGKTVVRTCAEPAPDVAMQIAANASLEIKNPGTASGAAGGTAAQAARVLSERTQMVMFFREALFRVCEISLNQNLDSAHVVTLYEHIINTALKLGSDKAFEVELLRAKADLEVRVAERQAAAVEVERLRKELEAANQATRQLRQAELDRALKGEQAASEKVVKAAAQLTGMAPEPATSAAPEVTSNP